MGLGLMGGCDVTVNTGFVTFDSAGIHERKPTMIRSQEKLDPKICFHTAVANWDLLGIDR